MTGKKAPSTEFESLNESLMPLDLENPEVEVLEQRLELAIASLPIGPSDQACFDCGYFRCKEFTPAP